LNTRERMRASNKLVRFWLLENKYDQIWFKPHSKRSDLVFTQNGNYLATDLWNLFDGICFSPCGEIIFLQMKTNRWAKEKEINCFVKRTKSRVLIFNVTNQLVECNKKYRVFVRKYGSID